MLQEQLGVLLLMEWPNFKCVLHYIYKTKQERGSKN